VRKGPFFEGPPELDGVRLGADVFCCYHAQIQLACSNEYREAFRGQLRYGAGTRV